MNSARWILAAVALPILVVAGCKSETKSAPQFGAVIGYAVEGVSPRAGPEAIRVDMGGKRQSLKSLYNDATILVVTNDTCLMPDSAPVRTSQWIDYRIPIIEVSSSHEGCPSVRQCLAARGEAGRHMVSLCDPLGFVRSSYGVTGPTAVLVLDDDGYVVAAGTLKDFDYLRTRATAQAEMDRKDRDALLYGGRR
jgi:hypothetical protein